MNVILTVVPPRLKPHMANDRPFQCKLVKFRDKKIDLNNSGCNGKSRTNQLLECELLRPAIIIRVSQCCAQLTHNELDPDGLINRSRQSMEISRQDISWNYFIPIDNEVETVFISSEPFTGGVTMSAGPTTCLRFLLWPAGWPLHSLWLVLCNNHSCLTARGGTASAQFYFQICPHQFSFPSFSVPLNKGGAHCPQSTTSTHFSINNCCRSQPQPCCGDNSCLMAQGEDNQSGVWSDRTAPNVSLNVSVGHWAVVCGSGQ